MEVYKLLAMAAEQLSVEEDARSLCALSSARVAPYIPAPPPPAPNTTFSTLQSDSEKMKALAVAAEQLLDERAAMLRYAVSALPRGQRDQRATTPPSAPASSTTQPPAPIPTTQPPTPAPARVPAVRRDMARAQTSSHDARGLPPPRPERPDSAPGVDVYGKRTRDHPEVLAWLDAVDKLAEEAEGEAKEGHLYPQDLIERAPPPPADSGLFTLCALRAAEKRRRLPYWVLFNIDRRDDTLDRIKRELDSWPKTIVVTSFFDTPGHILTWVHHRKEQHDVLDRAQRDFTHLVPAWWHTRTPKTRSRENKRKADGAEGTGIQPPKKRRRPAKLTMKKGTRKAKAKPVQGEEKEQGEQEQDVDVETESAVLMPPPPPPAPGRVVLRLPARSSAPTAAPAAVLAATPAAVPVPAAAKPKPTPTSAKPKPTPAATKSKPTPAATTAKPKPSPKKPKTTRAEAPKPTAAPKRQSKRIQAASDVELDAARFASEITLFTSKSSTLVNSMPPDLKRVVEGVRTPEPEKLEAIEEEGEEEEEEEVAPEPEPETKTKNARKPKGKKNAKGKGKAKAPPVEPDATEDEPDLPKLPSGLEKAETVKSWTEEVAASEADAVEEAQVEEEINVVEEVPVPDTTARAGSRAARARRPTQKAREAAAKASKSKAKSSRTKKASAGVEV
ncbi:hypothetical protein GLOTRDRAFT_92413 [Gloeophyllum trabeum ATCC 11539]|uniref:Uncharacterized protein n=1 Tax=Gloeophyllum trabeum (strain ATCC 11539 / FP-39264 / Madison 617) TaxID=670483 RepID=S7QDE9_GLOTA|nr:uncharacterized protein GLOTRDRAFT_92413 [Gloeophyllum trabeum ATCC 11539]EPQ57357.1 hypothetical protein GLOTRDRAFT_92413 [Gloeophyllum trabeum ATCC 11539]